MCIREWRFPHIIEKYNIIASDIVNSTNGDIHYLDLFTIAFHLFDLSFDDAHYQGIVGDTVAKIVLSYVWKFWSQHRREKKHPQ